MEGGWVCWNETFGAIPDRLLQCWRARCRRECSQAAKRGTEQKRLKRGDNCPKWKGQLVEFLGDIALYSPGQCSCFPFIWSLTSELHSAAQTLAVVTQWELWPSLHSANFSRKTHFKSGLLWFFVVHFVNSKQYPIYARRDLSTATSACPCLILNMWLKHKTNSPLPLILGHYSFCTSSIYFRESGQIFDLKKCLCTFVWLKNKKKYL